MVADLPQIDVALDRTASKNGQRNFGGISTANAGKYPGLDRFGRVIRQMWVIGAFQPQSPVATFGDRPPHVELTYSYDRASCSMRSKAPLTALSGASRDTAMRTQLLKIIARAGLKPWPKLWQNLRSTRQTELADSFPAHVASAWIGNSVPVAVKHYLQVTDDHFALAAEPEQVVQKAVQKAAETTGNEPQPVPAIVNNSAERAIPAAGRGSGDGPERTRTSDLALIRGAL